MKLELFLACRAQISPVWPPDAAEQQPHFLMMLFRTKITLLLILFYSINVNGAVPPCRWTFSTSQTYSGTTSLAAADAECKARAAASTVPAIAANAQDFVAWLSNDTHDALYRIGGGDLLDCFQNAIGNRVATTYVSLQPVSVRENAKYAHVQLHRPTAELLSGSLESSPFLWTEKALAQEEDLFTFTTSAGMSSEMNCNSQTGVSAGYLKGLTATMGARNVQWTVRSWTTCTAKKAIGCIQTPTPPPPAAEGFAYPLSSPCDAVAFVTAYRYFGWGLSNMDAMDEACRKEARNSVYGFGDDWQQYRAIYTIGERTTASMLSNTLCIGNLLGRPYWKRDSTSVPFTFVETPRFSPDGFLHVDTDDYIWTGSSPDLSSPMATCSDWTDAGGFGRVLDIFGVDRMRSCNAAGHNLLCVRAPNDYQGVSIASLVDNTRLMFVTHDKVPGNIGGLEAADEMCRIDASQSSLDFVAERALNFVAYLSTESMDAAARLIDLGSEIGNKSYVSTNGAPLFDSFSDILLTKPPDSSVYRNADGAKLFERLQHATSSLLLTATSPGGRYNGGGDCSGWWSDDTSLYTTYTTAGVGTSGGYLTVDRTTCVSYRHLLCVEVEVEPDAAHYSRTLKLDTPSPCMYIFRTNEKFNSDFYTFEVLDDYCKFLASNSTIPAVAANAQHFIGLVSNKTLSFRTRLQNMVGSVHCWKNTLETLLIPPNGNLFGGNKGFFSGFWADANGDVGFSTIQPFGLGTFMLTGTREDGTGDVNNCADWSGQYRATTTNGFELSRNSPTQVCNSVNYYACVQTNIEPEATSTPTVAPSSAPTKQPMFPLFLAPTERPPTHVLMQSTPMATTMDSATSVTVEPTLRPTSSNLQSTASSFSPSSPSTTHAATETETDTEEEVETTANNVDDMVSEPFDLLIPLIAGVGAFVVLLVCVVLLCVFMRRRRGARQHDNVVDGDARSRRSSYHGTRGRSDPRRSRMKATQSGASRRSRSRKSTRLSMKLSSSPWSNGGAFFDQSLPTIAGGEYQRMPTMDASVVYTSIGLAGAKNAAGGGPGTEYMDIAGPYGTMLSTDSTSTYQELRRVPKEAPILSYDAVPGGMSSAGESTSAAYGLMPSSARFDERNGGEYEYVEMSRMDSDK